MTAGVVQAIHAVVVKPGKPQSQFSAALIVQGAGQRIEDVDTLVNAFCFTFITSRLDMAFGTRQLVKQTVEAFPDFAKTAKEMFPDIEIEAAAEE